MRISLLSILAGMVFIAAGAVGAAHAAGAEEIPAPRTITVTGVGKIAAKPDIAVIQTGVFAQAPDAAGAMGRNSARMTALFAALRGAGVDEYDIRTSGLSLQPVYADRQSSSAGGVPQPPRVAAFRASNQVTVRFRDLPNVGRVLDALVGAGANQINGIQFLVSDAGIKLDQARAAATADAKRKADIYVRGVGVRLGKVLRIDEQGGLRPSGPAMARALAMESSAVPIAPGEQELSVSVTVVFELE